jgi:hypothetical protein
MMETIICKGDYFQFGSVFIEKNNQNNFFFKTETNSNRPISVRFCYFRTKLGSNQFGSVFRFDLVFSGLARFFFVWVWFGFFSFRLIKSKPNRTCHFFKNSNRFNRVFLRFDFFNYIF